MEPFGHLFDGQTCLNDLTCHFVIFDMICVVLQSPEGLHPGGNGQALWVSSLCVLYTKVAWLFIYLILFGFKIIDTVAKLLIMH